MNRRAFLGILTAAAAAPLLPTPAAPTIGLDLASGPDSTAIQTISYATRTLHTHVGKSIRLNIAADFFRFYKAVSTRGTGLIDERRLRS